MDISIVIPLLNEEESLEELFQKIRTVLNENNLVFEVIFVDDGSTDQSWKVIKSIKKRHGNVKAIRFRRNYGKAAALSEGFAKSTGSVVITMDADLQDSPDELPSLYKMINQDGYDLVSGWKKKRFDPLSKTIPSKLFNAVARKVSGINLHDFNCGLKAYDKKVIRNIHVYGDMHRWMPVLAKWEGFNNIGEKIVEHYPRKFGRKAATRRRGDRQKAGRALRRGARGSERAHRGLENSSIRACRRYQIQLVGEGCRDAGEFCLSGARFH